MVKKDSSVLIYSTGNHGIEIKRNSQIEIDQLQTIITENCNYRSDTYIFLDTAVKNHLPHINSCLDITYLRELKFAIWLE